MTVVSDRGSTEAGIEATEPAIVVSCDSHVGPLMKEQLRGYCPAEHLEEFDEFVATYQAVLATDRPRGLRLIAGDLDPDPDCGRNRRTLQNMKTAGHHDMHARLRDMDFDGVAADVIFNGSLNEEVVPWIGIGYLPGSAREAELSAAGMHMYNRWLADACSIEAERHVGLAQLPLWDLDASVRELEWAATAGLRGVNFPAPRPELPFFNDPVWDDFYDACEDLDLCLTTHAGGALSAVPTGVGSYALLTVEASGFASRRGLTHMTLGGVFARHPRLKLALTEQPGDWWAYQMRELESAYWRDGTSDEYHAAVEPPSYYFHRNVYVCASFMSHYEAERAVELGISDRMMWGTDYPHREGTFLAPEREDDPSVTKMSLKEALHEIPTDAAVAMAGGNAIDCYNLDREALRKVAVRIGALTAAELTTPNDLSDPVVAAAIASGRDGSYAFREGDALHS
jgi:predicted TIM-barrel fold metal-dependent hydrolase